MYDMHKTINATLLLAALALITVRPPFAGGHIKPGEELPLPEMTLEQMDGVRATIKKFENYSDDELLAIMARLPNEYGRLSSEQTTGDTGVLVLAHGFHGEGFEQFKETFKATMNRYPTTYGFGLAVMDSSHLQAATDSLQNSGVKRIVLMPASAAENSSMVRQWQYAFGMIDEPSYLDIPRVVSDVRFVWAPSPIPHEIVGEILRDHAKASSREPANELVVIMGHGPSDPADNTLELAVLDKHAAMIKREVGFADVRVANVQDDAPVEERAANVTRIRGWISEAKAHGQDVIVITTVLTAAGVLKKLQKDVEDLGVTFNPTGVMIHPRFSDWLEFAIQESIESTS
jgi:sirohydrochlorin ferrochelatase